jgi:hypothetical protein
METSEPLPTLHDRSRIGEGGDHVHSLLTLFGDELVIHECSRYPGPSVAVAEGNGVGDLIAASYRVVARKGIVKERVLAFGLARSIDRGQKCRVQDIADQRFVLGHGIMLLRESTSLQGNGCIFDYSSLTGSGRLAGLSGAICHFPEGNLLGASENSLVPSRHRWATPSTINMRPFEKLSRIGLIAS